MLLYLIKCKTTLLKRERNYLKTIVLFLFFIT